MGRKTKSLINLAVYPSYVPSQHLSDFKVGLIFFTTVTPALDEDEDLSSDLYNLPVWNLLITHSTEKETTVQRFEVTCPKSQGQKVAVLGFKSSRFSSRVSALNYCVRINDCSVNEWINKWFVRNICKKANILSQKTISLQCSLLLRLLSGSGPFTSLLFSLSSMGRKWAKVLMNPRKFTWSSLIKKDNKNMWIKVEFNILTVIARVA